MAGIRYETDRFGLDCAVASAEGLCETLHQAMHLTDRVYGVPNAGWLLTILAWAGDAPEHGRGADAVRALLLDLADSPSRLPDSVLAEPVVASFIGTAQPARDHIVASALASLREVQS